MKKSNSSNPVLIGLIKTLNNKAYQEKAKVWRDLAKRLSKPSSRRAAVNLGKIARHTEKKDLVAVPGKVLGSGSISHPVTIAAFEFSAQAQKKILFAGGKCLTFDELINTKPSGTGVKIMG